MKTLCKVLAKDTERVAKANELLERSKDCLKRWAGRYASSGNAIAHVKETKLLMQEIDEWILTI
jgi:hypothetical protein